MDRPGVHVVPIKEITGDADFNEVFFDGVQLPADALVGPVDQGWAISMGTLADERRVVGNLVIGLQAEAERLASVLLALGGEGSEHDTRFAVLRAGIEGLATLTESESGWGADFDSAGKIIFSELNLELARLCVDVAARYGTVVPQGWARRWSDNYMYARGYTIAGGANELLRGVLAHRALGLPRS
jgi:alkylation response protein AidB-like acyl-CoA dehydrogenase